jgi:hypothetical protein
MTCCNFLGLGSGALRFPAAITRLLRPLASRSSETIASIFHGNVTCSLGESATSACKRDPVAECSCTTIQTHRMNENWRPAAIGLPNVRFARRHNEPRINALLMSGAARRWHRCRDQRSYAISSCSCSRAECWYVRFCPQNKGQVHANLRTACAESNLPMLVYSETRSGPRWS